MFSKSFVQTIKYVAVTRYGDTLSQWHRQLWALGHVPLPSTSNNFILVHFGVNLRANYPGIV